VARIGCQLGHVPRKTGKTGTGGCCGETEQEYVQRLFTALEPKLKAAGHTPIKILADPKDGYPAMDAFFAFHCDGSTNNKARGCSFGYRTDLPNETASKAFGDRWRFEHTAAGYPGGNRPTNNTDGLAHYYALGPATNKGAKRAICIEFGFLTNKADNDWLIANVGAVADALVRTVAKFFGGTASPVPIPAFKTTLKPGDTGTGVEQVQRNLNRFLSVSEKLTVNGKFDTATKDALTKFQQNRRIPEPSIGVVGPGTWEMLFAPRLEQEDLRQGSDGTAVRQLKVALNRFPGNSFNTDDDAFDTRTKTVVQNWQDHRGQRVDGIVDRVTWYWIHAPHIPPDKVPNLHP
jgi:peptidoglycan hydrolase-like protein with peptidoglycan-binding domain